MVGPLFCLVFVHIYKEERGKNDPRGAAAVYLGFDDINNTYLVKDWLTGQNTILSKMSRLKFIKMWRACLFEDENNVFFVFHTLR